jgi:hypothetical protein
MKIDARWSGGNSRRSTIYIDGNGVGMFFSKNQGGTFPWDQVRRISFDDPGRTKANVGAIAVFGVAGMASRYAFSHLTISTLNDDTVFDVDEPVSYWRAAAARILDEAPIAAGRLFLEGQPVGAFPSSPTATPAGWYASPTTAGVLQWWDGQRWTDHTQPTRA